MGLDQVCFRDYCFDVEVAADDETRTRGLQGRPSLGENQGMLFIFPEARPYTFWMKDTLIPLDIIWMDQARRVVHIGSNIPPCQEDPCDVYSPPMPAVYVLELNANKAEDIGLHIGEYLQFHLKN